MEQRQQLATYRGVDRETVTAQYHQDAYRASELGFVPVAEDWSEALGQQVLSVRYAYNPAEVPAVRRELANAAGARLRMLVTTAKPATARPARRWSSTSLSPPRWRATRWVLAVVVVGLFLGALGTLANSSDRRSAGETPSMEPSRPVSGLEEDSLRPLSPSPAPTSSDAGATEQVGSAFSLRITPESFREKWNAAAVLSGEQLTIAAIVIRSEEDRDAFQYTFGTSLALHGSINKSDGTLREVTSLYAGSGESLADAPDAAASHRLLVAATNPLLTPDEQSELLRDLGFLDEDIVLVDLHDRATRRGVTYDVAWVNNVGLFFSARDADEQ